LPQRTTASNTTFLAGLSTVKLLKQSVHLLISYIWPVTRLSHAKHQPLFWLTSAGLPGHPYALHNNRARILQPHLTCTICSPQNMTPLAPSKLGLGLTLHHFTTIFTYSCKSLHISHLPSFCNTKLLSLEHSRPLQISLLGIFANFKIQFTPHRRHANSSFLPN
jgi:hypothetical protein